jgi:threonine synthase
VECFILYPLGRVSKIQEQQMATVPDANIHCLRVDGTFDDCQDIVKAAFMDEPFRAKVGLGAVNSINWARVLAQMTYYFYAYYQVAKQRTSSGKAGGPVNFKAGGPVNFSVPTGNFGDILAGYYAKRMGLPVGKLVVGTNENDILARFFATGHYEKHSIAASISPSMDICVSSNFERYLFHLAGDDAPSLRALMEAFEAKKGGATVTNVFGTASPGKLSVAPEFLVKAKAEGFAGERANTAEVLASIKATYETDKYLFCPHSACGVVAAEKLGLLDDNMVCLATAHAGKFYAGAVDKAISPLPPLPPALAAVQSMPMRMTDLACDQSACQEVVLERCGFAARPFSPWLLLPFVAFFVLLALPPRAAP